MKGTHMNDMNTVPRDDQFYKCFAMAGSLIERGYSIGNISQTELAETLWKLEAEKAEKNEKSDSNLIYNDEIVSIEEVGALETIDISVSGDNLFYCNGILTKNSFGLPATADLMFALISTEELEAQGHIMVKQLKNRYNNANENKRFMIGVDRSKMRLYDLAESFQQNITDAGRTADKNEQTYDDSFPMFDRTAASAGLDKIKY